jgi:hypothetical protein
MLLRVSLALKRLGERLAFLMDILEKCVTVDQSVKQQADMCGNGLKDAGADESTEIKMGGL